LRCLGGSWAEWERGYEHGFNYDFDGEIQPWRYYLFSKSYILGYRVGKAEIDRCVEIAEESRYFQ